MAVVATAATEFEHVSGMAAAATRGACIELPVRDAFLTAFIHKHGHRPPHHNHNSTTHKTKRRPTKRQYQTIKEGPAHKVDLPTHLVLAVVVSTIHGAAMRRARPRIRCSPPHLPDKSFFRPRSRLLICDLLLRCSCFTLRGTPL